jgi:hypothetical protein
MPRSSTTSQTKTSSSPKFIKCGSTIITKEFWVGTITMIVFQKHRRTTLHYIKKVKIGVKSPQYNTHPWLLSYIRAFYISTTRPNYTTLNFPGGEPSGGTALTHPPSFKVVVLL